jgi:hypothetical protein
LGIEYFASQDDAMYKIDDEIEYTAEKGIFTVRRELCDENDVESRENFEFPPSIRQRLERSVRPDVESVLDKS